MDLDECAYPDLNTCAGGINAGGVDADLFLDDGGNYEIYFGEPDVDDGFTQV